MTPTCSSDHAEHNLHCPISGPAEDRSAWTIRGSGPAYCRRPASAHAERSATLTLPYKGRESPQGDSVPLENPCNLERKQDGDADRSGPPWGRRPRRSPPWGDGLSPPTPLPVPGPGRVVGDGGLLGRGCLSDPGVPVAGVWICGVSDRGGILWGMSRTRWQGRDRLRLRQLVTDTYGWTCTLCHRPIDPHATALRDRLSIDHVLPVARGGSDSLENLRPTHHGCNSAKRDGRRLRRRATETAAGFFLAGLPGSLPPPEISPQ